MDGSAAQYVETPILVTQSDHPRVELYEGESLVDTIYVHRFSVEELHNLLEKDLGQPRDLNRTWEQVAKEAELEQAFSNWDSYKERHEPPKDEF